MRVRVSESRAQRSIALLGALLWQRRMLRPPWSSDIAFDRLDHPFFFTLDPFATSTRMHLFGVGALLSQNVRGRGAC
jgi:hypothetical protein